MDHIGRQVIEPDNVVQTVTELRRKDLFDLFHRVGAVVLLDKSDRFTLGFTHPGVGGHHQHDVAEISLTPVVIGQRAVVHHLQQQVKDVRMRFLDFVQQQHRVRMLDDRIGQQTALIEAYVSRRRANQATHRMAFHIFGHIETQQLNAHRFRQLDSHFRFTHPGRARKQEGAHRAMLVAKTRAAHLNSFGQRVDGFILAEYQHFQTVAKRFQRIAIALGDAFLRDTRNACHHGFDIRHVDRFLTLAHRHQTGARASLINDVNGLIRQMTIVDVFYRQLHRCPYRFRGVANVVVRFVLRLQTVEDLHGLFHRRLGNINFLETTRQRPVLLKDIAEFLIGG